MAQEEAKTAEEQKPVAGEAGPKAGRAKRKGLALGGGVVSLIGLAWALSVVAVPAKQVEVVHEIQGPFVADISPATGFQVNLAGRGGKNYLAMSLKAEVDAYAQAYAAERTTDPLYQAKLTDAVLKVAARKTKLDLDHEVGKDVFREELKVSLDPVLFPVHVGNEASAGARHAESGLRAGASNDRATMRGFFYEHKLDVDTVLHTIRLDDGQPLRFKGDETDLLVQDSAGRGVYVDVSGLHQGFRGQVRAGTFGRVRNIYFGSFLTQ